MKKSLLKSLAAAAAGLLLAGAALAQPAPPSDGLYRAFGEKPGLVALMDDFMARLLADARTGPHFKEANQAHVKEQLVEQFCALAGGPCAYRGADMKTAHAELDIKKSDFHALVEVLQASMDGRGIAFGPQNRMLALLAPMHRDIITPRQAGGMP